MASAGSSDANSGAGCFSFRPMTSFRPSAEVPSPVSSPSPVLVGLMPALPR